MHHGPVLVAAALTVLLAGTVLAALAALAGTAVESGAQARIAADPQGMVRITAHYDANGVPLADKEVRAALHEAFGPVPVTIRTALRAPAARSFDLPVLDAAGKPRPGGGVGVIALDSVREHARLSAGAWPEETAAGAPDTLQAALHEGLARRLHAEVGDTVVLSAAKGRVRLEVTGLWHADGRDSTLFRGLTSSFGGLDSLTVVSVPAFEANSALSGDALAGWVALPVADGMAAEELGSLRDRLAALEAGDPARTVFRGRPAAVQGVVAEAPLVSAIDRIDTPMVVARSGMYIPAALLAALAAAALVLTARQLTEHRRADTALLGARGAGTPRLLAAAGAEWAPVAVPAAVAAPFLAGPLLAVLDDAGLLPGEVPHSALSYPGWTAALLALLLHGVSALLPVVRAARDGRAVAKLRRRGAKAAAFQKAGTDVVLAAVAVLGWLQLKRYRSPVAGGDGGASVDPVLVLVPVVVTIAATLFTLRLLPLAERGAVWLARRSAGLVLPLGGWQVSRRAARHAGPALLMVLALAVGALTISALTMIDRSNGDRARHTVGADLRLTPDEFGEKALPGAARHSAYTALPGIEAATPVTDLPVRIDDDEAGITAIDTAEAAPTLRPGATSGPMPALRGDLADRRLPQQLSALGEHVPRAGVRLPGEPRAIAAAVTLRADAGGTPDVPRIVLTLQDASGLTDTVAARLPQADGKRHEIAFPLDVPGGGNLARHYPLTITRIAVDFRREPTRRHYDLTIHHFGSDSAAAAAPGPESVGWEDVNPEPPSARDLGCGDPDGRSGLSTAGVCDMAKLQPPNGLRASLLGPDGSNAQSNTLVEFGPIRHGRIPAVPALADDALLDSGRAAIGKQIAVETHDGTTFTLEVTGRIGGVPGFPHDGGRLLVDSRALAASLAQRGVLPPEENSWWLSARGADAAPAAAAIRKAEGIGTVLDVPQAEDALRGDPLQHGTRGVLVLCLILAPAFAVIGFTLHAMLSTRERRREFALLRAMGVRKRQLTGLLWTEQLLIAVVSVVLGAALGTTLAGLIVPLVTVDDHGSPVFPGVIATVPWERVALTTAATAVLITVMVTVMSRTLARVDLARVMRAGEQ
ncbi:ABC transporter permease [Streptomyces sp. JH14]|uniref:ABC transporter permease n=1 Tax=Streptomyces sp. JH14 TaxID=2793630 RepID=UPI0023F7ABAE|nr:ABC transporter permease [Streptomyces sp. JH14]MDF6042476.1 ABC transporter permease [Streptomyces sp. JH14]